MHFTRLYDRTTVPYFHDCVMNAIYSAQPVAMAVKQKIKAVRAFITGGHAANPCDPTQRSNLWGGIILIPSPHWENVTLMQDSMGTVRTVKGLFNHIIHAIGFQAFSHEDKTCLQ